jgi:hypothetical protein
MEYGCDTPDPATSLALIAKYYYWQIRHSCYVVHIFLNVFNFYFKNRESLIFDMNLILSGLNTDCLKPCFIEWFEYGEIVANITAYMTRVSILWLLNAKYD